jgi:hypothetical protein
MTEEIHVNDVGTVFVLQMVDKDDTPLDISTATNTMFTFRKNDGTTIVKTAIFTGNGGDGKLQYTTIGGDMNQSGFWSVQAKVVMPAGTWYSAVIPFKVHENL